jgi:serine phosphatase RsbU (regulator of sigma subunit)
VAPAAPHPAAGTSRPAPHKAKAQARPAFSVVTRTVTRTVRDIVHELPAWAKALIAALAALLGVAALLVIGAALRNRRLARQRAALADQVGVLQSALLPVVPPHVGALGVSVAYLPAAGLAAGGDFYDVFPLDHGRVGIVVGDVSGHGRESLGPATFIRHMVRSYLEAGLVPRAALQLAGNVVDAQRRDDFATVVAAVHDPAAGTFSYATAGHPPPIITGPGAHIPLTVGSSPPVGVGTPTGLRQTTLPLAPGSTVCLFTDGLIEARRDGGMYGLPRLQRVVGELGPEQDAHDIVARVARESDRLADDIAVCLVRAEGGAAAPSTVRVEEIEVRMPELHGPRLRRFLEACDITGADVEGVIKAAAPRVVKYGSVVLRVRLAEDRSGVDVLPVEAPAGGELTALRRNSA